MSDGPIDSTVTENTPANDLAERSLLGEIDDRQLILRAQDGETEAFGQLVDRYQGRLFRTAYMILADRQDSEDVVQETLILAWKRLHLLENPAAFRGWVSQICSRRATDMVRRRARRQTDAHDPEDLQLESNGMADGSRRSRVDPAHTTEVNAQLHALAQILATLDSELRVCWVLREIEELSYREIAQTLSLTEPTVRGRIARARTQIIQRMEEWR
ncbi:RNA polymerase sigma factor [Enemella evansiae]|uniref:RNA polymerase subunit sigma-70 n=1 Tax=Enemella evansiae TaxID=2016499 RepID=A0A255GPA3_9ACTN|nr:sigma-70 family RNA polymerase sigma factor [Enemella evansiae]OYO17095.1 RNA polymerase subunit sigma-70 [Enemella evansiae]OYO17639.1 RNA polymerase subunit sigma-70 [Enemella evansiae]TDO89684.1 RNA polymerase sigma-70 factor (ECF subfamily) [Enemella evansiae]